MIKKKVNRGKIRDKRSEKPTLLVFNCHEGWVYQLGALGFNLDIIVGLSGRYHEGWDSKMRPQPPNSRLIDLKEAQTTSKRYHCIITHNITDLLDAKHRTEPKLLVLHSTLEGRASVKGANLGAEEMKQLLAKYIDLTRTHVVSVSQLKGESWGQTEDIVTFSVDPDDYLPYNGDIAGGLRISNFIHKREKILLWDFHMQAFAGVPVTLVGHNPDMTDVNPSDNWQNLKKILRAHRFYVHTAHPQLEDGYNMATLEAMAAGLPVLGNNHPTSIITHRVNGFLSDDPQELSHFAKMLLQDRDLAQKMGRAAQETVRRRFSHLVFREKFLKSISTACSKRSPSL